MPRKLRLEYPGALYHAMNRGDRRENIFRDDVDRGRFLATLGEACGRTEWQVHAYCLMRNHFHLVLETPQANLVAGMKWLLGVYTNFRRRMERRRQDEEGSDYRLLRRGWCLGSEAFRQELLAAAEKRVGAQHYGAERRETGEQKARRILGEEIERLGWQEEDLRRRRKGGPREGGHCAPVAAGNHDESAMDRGARGDGQLDVCLEPAEPEVVALILCQ